MIGIDSFVFLAIGWAIGWAVGWTVDRVVSGAVGREASTGQPSRMEPSWMEPSANIRATPKAPVK